MSGAKGYTECVYIEFTSDRAGIEDVRNQLQQLLDSVLKQFDRSYRSHRISSSSPAALMSENQILTVTESYLNVKCVFDFSLCKTARQQSA